MQTLRRRCSSLLRSRPRGWYRPQYRRAWLILFWSAILLVATFIATVAILGKTDSNNDITTVLLALALACMCSAATIAVIDSYELKLQAKDIAAATASATALAAAVVAAKEAAGNAATTGHKEA